MRAPYIPQIRLYQNWLQQTRGLTFDSYDALWRWSVTDLDAFWQSIWDYFDLQSPTPHTAVLADGRMPGARWFPGAQVNYAQQVFRHVHAAAAAGLPAIISHNEKSLASGNPACVRSAGPPQASTAPVPGERGSVLQQAHEVNSVGAPISDGPPLGKLAPSGGSELHEVNSVGAVLSWPALRQQVASLALHLKAQGVQPGDRVAAYLPNIPEAMVAFLATVSVGAVWSICAPDMGTHAVLDRFKQIEPKVLIACDGVTYGGRYFDRTAVLGELSAALPSLQHVIVHNAMGAINSVADHVRFHEATERNDAETAAFEPLWLAFDHPLWIVYSSGTTGLPKPIVHGHGGTLIVALALKVLHNDIGCSYAANSWGERYHWYSSTGWVMWNAQMSGLLNGTTCVTFDGNPGGSKDKPDWTTLWRFAAQTGVSFFGAGAAFYANCMKAGVDLSECGDLTKIRALGSTGSPLSEEAQRWGTRQFRQLQQHSAPEGGSSPTQQGPRDWLRQTAGAAAPSGLEPAAPNLPEQVCTGDRSEASGERRPARCSERHEVRERGGDIWWCNISGGTDFAGAFIGGNRELPLVVGEMQCRLLGCAVEAWNESGQPVIGEVGELVCSQPLPSMPLYFWGDTGNARYLSSYFDMYPNVWRHGDWLKVTASGSCIIYGRSDATINRHGLRMGTSELYSAIEALPEVLDSMVVDLEYLGRESYMPLFVTLKPGVLLDESMKAKLNNAIRAALSPRFVPNDIFLAPEIPRTLSGKKQELPIKKLLLGQPLEKVVNRDAMANPDCLSWYVEFARMHAAKAA